MLNIERVIQLENAGDRHDDRKYLERVEKLTLLASNSFHYLKFFNHMNIPSNYRHGMSKVKPPCDSCGG